MKTTPGPWVWPVTGPTVLGKDDGSSTFAPVCRIVPGLAADGNARLIAAAPDMLATLKGILSYVEDGNVVELRPCGFVEEVKAAIAKAEGGAT